MAYDALQACQPERASREYVQILYLAAHESEAGVDEALQQLLAENEPVTAACVQALLSSGRTPPAVPVVTVAMVS